MARTKKLVKKNKKVKKKRRTHEQSVRDGKKAHDETIGPSHDECEKKLRREYQNDHVTSTTGMPDFVIFNKGTKFVELKPCRLSKNQRASFERMYLSLTQEITILFLLNCGAYVGIRYYIKIGKKFRYSKVVKLTLRNYKSYCFSAPWNERFDPDKLFK